MTTQPAKRRERARWLGTLCDGLERVTFWVTSILLVVMLAVALAHIFWRYVLNNALPWSEEFLRYSLVWFAMLSASIMYKRREHLGLVFVVRALPPRARTVVDRAMRWLLLILSVVISYHAVDLLVRVQGQHTPALRIPMAIPYGGITVAFMLMAVYSVWHLVSPGPYSREEEGA